MLINLIQILIHLLLFLCSQIENAVRTELMNVCNERFGSNLLLSLKLDAGLSYRMFDLIMQTLFKNRNAEGDWEIWKVFELFFLCACWLHLIDSIIRAFDLISPSRTFLGFIFRVLRPLCRG
jgi:hypothetical protein